MKMSTISAIVTVVGLTFSASAMAETMSKQEYKTGKDRIEADYKADKKNCESMSDNAKDICMAQAKGKMKVSEANLDARNKNTRKARYDAQVAKAEAEYSVAKEKCDDKKGNDKDVCLKEAKAAEVSAKADARAKMQTSNAYSEAGEKSDKSRRDAKEKANEAKKDAAEDKQDAKYNLAKEKCDVLSGEAKDNCIKKAKTDSGKNREMMQ